MDASYNTPKNLKKEEEELTIAYLNNDECFDWDEYCTKHASKEYNKFLKEQRKRETKNEKNGMIEN